MRITVLAVNLMDTNGIMVPIIFIMFKIQSGPGYVLKQEAFRMVNADPIVLSQCSHPTGITGQPIARPERGTMSEVG